MPGDEPLHQGQHPADEGLLAEPPIGEHGVVGRIEKFGLGPQPDDLAEDREAAEARVEHQDAGRGGARPADGGDGRRGRHGPV